MTPLVAFLAGVGALMFIVAVMAVAVMGDEP
jgi:hypothetical protein